MVPHISIIVPIYNGEKYLSRCLDSILGQTYKDFELILVNDGSVDGSLNICKRYAEKDGRVSIIDKKNEGVSMARNDAMQKAMGQYIAFVDCDDWLDADCLQMLVNGMGKDYDLSIVGYREVGVDGTVYKDSTSVGINRAMSVKEAMIHLFTTFDFFSLCYPWGKLFKRDIIQKYGLRFNKNIAIGEDRLFIFEYLQHAGKVFCNTKAECNYVQNPQGAMRMGITAKFLTCFDAMDIMRGKCNDSEVKRVLNNEYAYMLMSSMRKDADTDIKCRVKHYARYYQLHPCALSWRQWVKLNALSLFNVKL